jgi:hypothetical protein
MMQIYELVVCSAQKQLDEFIMLILHVLRIVKSDVKLSTNRPWRPIGLFPVRYEHHLHINK